MLVVVMLCALSIWTFTPVSEEANYKPVQVKKTIPKNAFESTARSTPGAPPEQAAAENVALPASLDDQPDLQTIEPDSVKAVEIADTLSEPAPAKTESIRSRVPVHKNAPLSLEVFAGPAEPVTANQAASNSPELPAEAVASIPTPRSEDSIEPGRVETFSIKPGDTLTRIFSNAKLPISQAIKLSRNKAASQLNRLSIG
ncbi:MAG: hypothetical protein GY697_28805, partial [Desulfobacterales bacterium]|nr:hypothetical protein [Desulfobacterales bacterium]